MHCRFDSQRWGCGASAFGVAAVLAVFAALVACSSTPVTPRAAGPGSGPWQFGTPEEHGLDPRALAAAAAAVGQIAGRQGIVFVRNGVIVHEQYWSSDYFRAEPSHRNVSFSAGKSWGAALVGVAVTQGRIAVEDHASKYVAPEMSGLNANVTIEQLLTMTSGGTLIVKPSSKRPRRLDDTSPRGPGVEYSRTSEPERGAPPGYGTTLQPGSVFYYDGAPADHLAGIVAAAVGRTSHAYIAEQLLKPLGVEHFAYQREGVDSQGNIRIGGSIELSVRDMARLGQLYLNRGRWGDRQLIDANYIARSTTPSLRNPSYGYLWWLNREGRIPTAPRSMYYAAGAFGQYVFVLPEHDMVIATMGFDPAGRAAQDPSLLWQALSAALPHVRPASAASTARTTT